MAAADKLLLQQKRWTLESCMETDVDLQDLASVAELIAAVGVIASLIYVGIQVKQAHRVATAENAREVQAGFSGLFRMLAQDADLARIYRLGCENPAQLDRTERQRFEHLLGTFFLHFIECYTAHRGGLMDAELYQRWRHGIATIWQTRGATEWWLEIRGFLKEDVVKELDELRDKVGTPTELRPLDNSGGRGAAL